MTAGQRKLEGQWTVDYRKAANLDQRLKEDTRSSQEYLNDLDEEYQSRALLAKSKRFFKKDDNDMVEVKVLMALAKDNHAIRKEGVKNGEWVKISMRKILRVESKRNTTDPLVAIIDSSAIDYDSTDESSVCRTPLPPLKKLDGAGPVSGPKTIKSILRLKSTFKAKTLKGVTKAVQLQKLTQLLLVN
nr:hypothetical protein [Tanacetum cinerariifolium]